MNRRALKLLDDALRYIYVEAQEHTHTLEDHEDFSVTLRLIGVLRNGEPGPDPFNVACYYALGLSHQKYLKRRAERAAFMAEQLLLATPDDSEEATRVAEHTQRSRYPAAVQTKKVA